MLDPEPDQNISKVPEPQQEPQKITAHIIFYFVFIPGTGEGGAVAAGAGDDLTGKGKQSRGEKKARKIMSKLGLKQVSFLSSSIPNPQMFPTDQNPWSCIQCMKYGSGMSINYGPGFYLANCIGTRTGSHGTKYVCFLIGTFLLCCCGSVTFWYGSGSADSWIRITDSRIRSGFCSFRQWLSRCLLF